MEGSIDRYSGLVTIRSSYMKKFAVECSKCKNLAVVTTKQSYDRSNHTLICNTCSHREKADQLIRYKAAVKSACGPYCRIVRTYNQ
jgi:ribosomal protein S27E